MSVVPGKMPSWGTGLAAALVTVLTLTLSGCSMQTTAPGSARADAAPDAKGSFGSVDCRKAKCIALTFDAGPGENTPRLLDILKEKKVPATFFLLGKNHVLKHPDTVRRIAAEGHEVANHTWSHEILTDKKPDEIRAELEKTQDAIAEDHRQEAAADASAAGPHRRRRSPGSARSSASPRSCGASTAKDYTTNDSTLIRKRILDQTEQGRHHPAPRHLQGHGAGGAGHHRRAEASAATPS